MLPDNATHFPLEKDNPLSFVDHSLLALVQVADVYDLNQVLGAFLADEVISFVEENKHMFSVLSGTICNKIRETVFNVPDMTFPDGLLMIPPLFDQFEWTTSPDTWSEEKSRYQAEYKNEPCLTYALALLFINAMSDNMDSAMQQFEQDIATLSEDEQIHADRYLENLQFFGWPVEKLLNAAT
jgi:hypothetical protein